MQPRLDCRNPRRYGASVNQNARAKRLGILFCIGVLCGRASAQDFSDMFAGRQVLTNVNALVTGSNSNATVEPYEPKHAGKIGGKSVWISWQAPDNGLVTLNAAGSTFDTLLAVYRPEHGAPSLQRLEEAASDDDYDRVQTSYLQFGARSNRVYEIAVDGFNGASRGDFASTQFPLVVEFAAGRITSSRRPGAAFGRSADSHHAASAQSEFGVSSGI